MNKYTKKQLLIGGVILLVVINLAALGTFLYQNYQEKQSSTEYLSKKQEYRRHAPDSMKYPRAGDHFGRFLKNKLNFDEEQFNEFNKLRAKTKEKQFNLHKKIKEHRSEMMEELASDSPDEEKLHEINDSITTMQSDLNKILFNYFQKVREISNPDQRETFNQMIKEMHKHKYKQPMHRRNSGRNRK
ncbi:MAG: hypothetical protein R6U04_11105 [Bacteroidales bacterium]